MENLTLQEDEIIELTDIVWRGEVPTDPRLSSAMTAEAADASPENSRPSLETASVTAQNSIADTSETDTAIIDLLESDIQPNTQNTLISAEADMTASEMAAPSTNSGEADFEHEITANTAKDTYIAEQKTQKAVCVTSSEEENAAMPQEESAEDGSAALDIFTDSFADAAENTAGDEQAHPCAAPRKILYGTLYAGSNLPVYNDNSEQRNLVSPRNPVQNIPTGYGTKSGCCYSGADIYALPATADQTVPSAVENHDEQQENVAPVSLLNADAALAALLLPQDLTYSPSAEQREELLSEEQSQDDDLLEVADISPESLYLLNYIGKEHSTNQQSDEQKDVADSQNFFPDTAAEDLNTEKTPVQKVTEYLNAPDSVLVHTATLANTVALASAVSPDRAELLPKNENTPMEQAVSSMELTKRIDATMLEQIQQKIHEAEQGQSALEHVVRDQRSACEAQLSIYHARCEGYESRLSAQEAHCGVCQTQLKAQIAALEAQVQELRQTNANLEQNLQQELQQQTQMLRDEYSEKLSQINDSLRELLQTEREQFLEHLQAWNPLQSPSVRAELLHLVAEANTQQATLQQKLETQDKRITALENNVEKAAAAAAAKVIREEIQELLKE